MAATTATALQDQRQEPLSGRRLSFLMGIAFLLASDLVIVLASHVRSLAHLPRYSEWNWFGKAMSIVFSFLVLACSPWLRQNVGLRWQQAPGSMKLSLACFLATLCSATCIGFLIPPVEFSADTLAFQFLMPGVDEQLLLNGIALALFERAFGQSPMSCRLRFGRAALVTSTYFGFMHAVSIIDGQLQFSLLHFLVPALLAAADALVRTRSGSLLWPILSHGAWDGTLFLVPMLR